MMSSGLLPDAICETYVSQIWVWGWLAPFRSICCEVVVILRVGERQGRG